MALRNYSGIKVVLALVEYMADAMDFFRLKYSGLWFKDTKSLVKLIWHFGAWLVAEQNLTKRLVPNTFGSPQPF
jgi:hypothetical protein